METPALPFFRWEIISDDDEDMSLLLQWRNDPVTRHNSFHTNLKDPSLYRMQFWQRHGAIASLPPLFICRDGLRIGALLFEHADHPRSKAMPSCEISIMLDPKWRRLGLGSAALKAILPWVRRRGVDAVLAKVRLDNEASLRAFAKAGFTALHDDLITIDTETSIPYRLCEALLRPQPSWGDGVYVIAEAGSNWRMGTPQRDAAMARTLIEVAADSGADAIKFQTFRPETIYVPNAGEADYLRDVVGKHDISAIFADLSMPYDLVESLSAYCRQCGIDFMSTPFSPADFKQVDPFVKMHKIASYEISHLRLLECAAQAGKPLFLSTGSSTPYDVEWAVSFLRQQGLQQIVLMQCTAKYGAPDDQMNLRSIAWLRQQYDLFTGLSDHSRDPFVAPLLAVGYGAVAVEKHFTLSNKLPGPDHFFALEPNELKAMVGALRSATQMRGAAIKGVQPCEKELFAFARRGIQALRDIHAGETLHEGVNAAILRPGKQKAGAHPRHLPLMEGKTLLHDIPLGCGILPEDLSP